MCFLNFFSGSFSYVCFCFVYLLLLYACLYPNEREKENVDLGGWGSVEDLGRVEVTIVTIYYMEKIC